MSRSSSSDAAADEGSSGHFGAVAAGLLATEDAGVLAQSRGAKKRKSREKEHKRAEREKERSVKLRKLLREAGHVSKPVMGRAEDKELQTYALSYVEGIIAERRVKEKKSQADLRPPDDMMDPESFLQMLENEDDL